jgi:hypothetical protein
VRYVALVALAACSGGSTRAPEAPVCPVCATTDTPVDAGVVAEAPAVAAIEWPAVDAMILEGAAGSPWRALQIASGPGWLRLGGPATRDYGVREVLEEPAELVVAEVRDDAVRVLVDGGDERYLVWIAATDLGKVVVEPIEVGAGHTLLPGLPVTWVPDGPDGVAVLARQDGLVVEAQAPASAIGEIWREPDTTATADTVLKAGTPIRMVPVTTSDPYLTTTGELHVRRLPGAEDGYVEIESLGRLHYSGWVPKKAAKKLPPPMRGRVVYAVEVGCRRSLDVIANACVYDAKDGEVIGIHKTERGRCASDRGDGWWEVSSWSPTGQTQLWLHAVDAGNDELEFDVCEGE